MTESDLDRYLTDRSAAEFKRPFPARSQQRFRAMLGARFGKLTVLRYHSLRVQHRSSGASNPEPVWECRCDCGALHPVRDTALRSKDSKSCGACEFQAPQWPEWTLRQVALAIEWEGSIGVYESKSPQSTWKFNHNPAIVVSVVIEDRILVDGLMRLTGLGSVTTTWQEMDGHPGAKREKAQWQVGTKPEAIALAKALEPFLVTKYEQAQLVASFPYKPEKHAPVPEKMFLGRRELAQRTRLLNPTGLGPQAPEAVERARRWKEWSKSAPELQRHTLLAQAIDFEGTLGVRSKHQDDLVGGEGFQPVIHIGQALRRTALLEIPQALAAPLAISIKHGRPPGQGNRDATLQWSAEGEKAQQAAQMIAPYLVVKQEQARCLIDYPLWKESPKPLPESYRLQREALHIRTQQLNKKYEPPPTPPNAQSSAPLATPPPGNAWAIVKRNDPRVRELVDRHYSRVRPGTEGFTRPGYALVLWRPGAAFVWWRPAFEKGYERQDKLRCLECTLFRNEDPMIFSSILIQEAEKMLLNWPRASDVELPDGLITSINVEQTQARRSQHSSPGQCFRHAGWEPFKHPSNTKLTWLSKSPTKIGLVPITPLTEAQRG